MADNSAPTTHAQVLSVRGAMGLDVLVESQHVVWVVLFLDLHKASIVRPIARAHQLVTRIAQLVYVHSMCKGPQIVARSLHPSHHFRLHFGSVPNTRNVYFITRLAESKCGIGHSYTANGPAQRHNDYLACGWRIVDRRCNCRNGSSAEFSKNEICLEVRNRRSKKS